MQNGHKQIQKDQRCKMMTKTHKGMQNDYKETEKHDVMMIERHRINTMGCKMASKRLKTNEKRFQTNAKRHT